MPEAEKGKGVKKESVKVPGGIKVLHLASKYTGDYPLFNSMVTGLDPARYEAKVCYLRGSPDGGNTLDGSGKAIYLDHDGRLGGSRLKTVCALTRLFKRERPDILHCHRHKPTVLGIVAALFSGVPHIIAHVHGLNRTRTLSRRLVNKLVLGRVEKVLTVSDGVSRDVLASNPGLGAVKVSTIHNGIDLEAFDGLSVIKGDARPDSKDGARPGAPGTPGIREALGVRPGDFVFGNVGRLARTKGQAYLIEAFAEVLKKLANVKVKVRVRARARARLVIIGDGPLRAELEDSARRLGISDKVNFLGQRHDVPSLLKGFDVFVFPSLAEGLPLGLLEAMASSLPIVASRVGGIPEVVTVKFARLVPPAEPASLADAMVGLAMAGEEEALEMGRAARERVEVGFTAQTMCRSLMEVYADIMGSGA